MYVGCFKYTRPLPQPDPRLAAMVQNLRPIARTDIA